MNKVELKQDSNEPLPPLPSSYEQSDWLQVVVDGWAVNSACRLAAIKQLETLRAKAELLETGNEVSTFTAEISKFVDEHCVSDPKGADETMGEFADRCSRDRNRDIDELTKLTARVRDDARREACRAVCGKCAGENFGGHSEACDEIRAAFSKGEASELNGRAGAA